MSPTQGNYVSTKTRERQATKAWLIGLGVVAIWLVAILAAPLAKIGGLETASAALYKFYGFLCHQIPDRSFHIAGEKFGVCSRCFGVYSGLVAGFLLYPLWRKIDNIDPLPKVWLFLSLVPITVDWSLTIFGIWENTHLSRFLTGLILGVACATYIIPAIVEITRNITHRRRTFVDSGS
jgi:uncharacterized membrane protein